VSAPLIPEVLGYELAIRCMSARDLARKGGFSPATVSGALAGKPIWEDSLRRIAAVLAATPVNEVVKRLLKPPEQAIEGPPAKPAPSDGESQEVERVCPFGAHCGLRGESARIIDS
jgi:transcriptional regulator with XRE-family HTH domain